MSLNSGNSICPACRGFPRAGALLDKLAQADEGDSFRGAYRSASDRAFSPLNQLILFMMKRRFATLLYFGVAFLFAAELPANANTFFSCKDLKGKLLFGSSTPEGCVGEICETQPNGVRKCLPPPETPEQRSKREAKEKKRRDCEKKARDSLLDDFGFLDRYPRRENIEVERDREIAKQRKRIRDANERRDLLRDKEARLEKEAEFYGPKHPMPDELRADIDSNRKVLDAQEALVLTYEKEMNELNETYDKMAKRREEILLDHVGPVHCEN